MRGGGVAKRALSLRCPPQNLLWCRGRKQRGFLKLVMRETRGSQTLGEPSQLSSKSDGAVIGTRERVDLISANKTRPQAPEAQGGRGGVRGSLSVKLPIMGSGGALGAGPAPGLGRRLLAQGPLSFSFTSTPYKYLFCCFSCCLGEGGLLVFLLFLFFARRYKQNLIKSLLCLPRGTDFLKPPYHLFLFF